MSINDQLDAEILNDAVAEERAKWLPIVEAASGELCIRRVRDMNGPTCRSPIPSEGWPRDRWCFSCRAREAIKAFDPRQGAAYPPDRTPA